MWEDFSAPPCSENTLPHTKLHPRNIKVPAHMCMSESVPNISKQYDHVGAPDRAQMHTHTKRPLSSHSQSKLVFVDADQVDNDNSNDAKFSSCIGAVGAITSAAKSSSKTRKYKSQFSKRSSVKLLGDLYHSDRRLPTSRNARQMRSACRCR